MDFLNYEINNLPVISDESGVFEISDQIQQINQIINSLKSQEVKSIYKHLLNKKYPFLIPEPTTLKPVNQTNPNQDNNKNNYTQERNSYSNERTSYFKKEPPKKIYQSTLKGISKDDLLQLRLLVDLVIYPESIFEYESELGSLINLAFDKIANEIIVQRSKKN
jgi:hypothetical protein